MALMVALEIIISRTKGLSRALICMALIFGLELIESRTIGYNSEPLNEHFLDGEFTAIGFSSRNSKHEI